MANMLYSVTCNAAGNEVSPAIIITTFEVMHLHEFERRMAAETTSIFVSFQNSSSYFLPLGFDGPIRKPVSRIFDAWSKR